MVHHELMDSPALASARGRLTAADAGPEYADRSDPYGSAAADPEPRVSLLEDGELQSMTMRWKDIQAEFVDEPREAVDGVIA